MINEDDEKMLSPELVLHMADLSRLKLSDAEVEKFGRQFAVILGYMKVLNKVDAGQADPLYSCAEQTAAEREDIADNRRSQKEVLANAPETDGEYFLVPRII